MEWLQMRTGDKGRVGTAPQCEAVRAADLVRVQATKLTAQPLSSAVIFFTPICGSDQSRLFIYNWPNRGRCQPKGALITAPANPPPSVTFVRLLHLPPNLSRPARRSL